MCGILGAINREITSELLNTIKHRGPDRQSIVHDVFERNQIDLAHTRLSIVELSEAGNQPMESRCGDYVLVFNGEIYNHLDLRKQLRFQNFRGLSDSETLLYYLVENGVEGLNRLNGIFAFAFWKRRTGELILARDKYGVKPLYYYYDEKSLMFSSEIRPLEQALRVGLDQDVLPILLSLRYVPSPYTLFKGVKKLPPGHYMCCRVKERNIEFDVLSYDIHKVQYCDLSFGEAVKIYGERFDKAVERQMMSDVELGILLSGGIDSALVASSAIKHSTQKLKAFTVGFDSKFAVNELDNAAYTAKQFGLEHHTVKISSSSFFSIFEECSRIVEEPLATTSFIPMYYLSKLAAQTVKVVLTGQGADEPLGGYGRYQGEILHENYPLFFWKIVASLVKLSGCKKESLIRGVNSLPIKDDIRRYLSVYSLFTPTEIEVLTGSKSEKSIQLIEYYYNLLNCKFYKTSAERMMAIDQRMDLPDDLLLYTDKITMNFSVECRVPLLDYDLMDFLDSLPLSYKVSMGKTKIIHREYAKLVLPKEIVDRPKLGFQSPTNIWFREAFEEVEHLLIGKDSKLLDYLDRKEIRNILLQHKNGYNRDKQIFLLLGLRYWLDK